MGIVLIGQLLIVILFFSKKRIKTASLYNEPGYKKILLCQNNKLRTSLLQQEKKQSNIPTRKLLPLNKCHNISEDDLIVS